jgi:hypothetical protein
MVLQEVISINRAAREMVVKSRKGNEYPVKMREQDFIKADWCKLTVGCMVQVGFRKGGAVLLWLDDRFCQDKYRATCGLIVEHTC